MNRQFVLSIVTAAMMALSLPILWGCSGCSSGNTDNSEQLPEGYSPPTGVQK